MPSIPRRVVTGHDASGRSVFASDDPVPAAPATPGGTLFYELWATFLLSARAAYLNGQDIPVDGGFSSHGGAKSITDALAKAHPDSW
jgi:hypothetical protein